MFPLHSSTGPSAFHSLSSLPGAWSSNWSLSPQAENETDTVKAPNCTVPRESFQTSGNAHPALKESARREWRRSPTPTESPAYDYRASVALSEDSMASDDFYSFTSHEDPDTTLHTNTIVISPSKGIEKHEAVMGPFHHAKSSFGSSELTPSLHGSSTGDATLSDIASSEDSLRRSGSSSTKASHVALPVDSAASASRFQSRPPPEISIRRGSPRSTLSPRVSTSSCVHDADDDASRLSIQSNYSARDFALLQSFLRHPPASSSEESVGLRPPEFPQFERHNRRQRVIEANDYGTHGDSLLLSQPDGNNPWTLSMDPALTSESVSQSSASCHSVTNSLVSRDEGSSLRYPASPSLRSASPELNPALLRPSFHHPYGGDFPDAEVSTTRQGSRISIRDARQGHSVTQFSQKGPQNPASPKKALQKTKQFYLKIKKLFTPKVSTSSRSITRRSLNDSSVAQEHGLHAFPGAEAPQAVPSPGYFANTPSTQGYSQPPTASHPIYRRPFTRSLKLSLPSAALSYTPERTSNHPASSVEQHARPKTLAEIKYKRRFSLPTAFTNAVSRPNSSSGRTINASRTHIPADGSLEQGVRQNLRPRYA